MINKIIINPNVRNYLYQLLRQYSVVALGTSKDGAGLNNLQDYRTRIL